MMHSSRTVSMFSALVLSLGVGLPAAHTQTVTRNVVATVPFDFESGSVHMPAGKYTLHTDGQTNFMTLRGDSDGVNLLMQVDEAREPAPGGKLIFHRYGRRYFLREVRFAGSPVFLKCSETRTEKKERIAANAAPASLTEVAAVAITH